MQNDERFDAVISATPAAAAAAMLSESAPESSSVLRSIEYADVAMVRLAIPSADWPGRLHGRSGYLVPKPVQHWVTAASFGSQKWEHWQPTSGEQILRVSLGRDGLPTSHLNDDEVLRHTIDDLGKHLGFDVQPTSHSITRWVNAFPQYRPHHAALVERAERRLPAGLALAGASYRGIGIPACIADGQRAAHTIKEIDRHCRWVPDMMFTVKARPHIDGRLSSRRAVAFAAASLLALAACGGSDGDDSAAATPSTTEAAAAATTTEAIPEPTASPTTVPATTVATTATQAPTTAAATTTTAPSTTLPTIETVPPVTAASTTTTLAPEPIAPPPDAHAQEPVIEVGSISIPKIDVDMTMYEGIRLTTLEHGPGHWPGTAMPGDTGNVVVGGHRTSSHRVFRNVDQLEAGDEIIFRDADGEHVYHVNRVEIVQPDAVWIVDQTETAPATLFACHPPGSTAQRIVVFADLADA